MIDKWLYRRKTKALLQSEYEYTVDDWQENIVDDICADARGLNLAPADAAAMFIEVACLALARPLSANSAEFAERMSFYLLQSMHAGETSSDNFTRAARFFVISKGAPSERLDEVEEIAEPFLKAMLARRQSGLVYDAAAAMDQLLEIAVARGIVPARRELLASPQPSPA